MTHAATADDLRAKAPIERTATVALDDDHAVTVRFRSIGSRAYSALVAAHQEGAEPGMPFNANTFAPALVAAAAVEPALTAEQVAELYDTWTTAEFLALFVGALDANTASNVQMGA